MRIEKLSKGRKKKIVLVITILVLLMGIIYITNSRAKYHVTSNIQIVKGKVSYSLADLNVVALKVQESEYSETYNPTDEVPKGSYELNKEKSYCTIPGDNIQHKDIPMEYKDGKVSISITKKGTKCYVYLDMYVYAREQLLANRTIEEGNKDGFTDMDVEEHIGENDKSILYSDEDDLGTTYYFRGRVKDNWVKFGKVGSEDIWWRIIRINGNGSIRMIYTGTGTTIPTDDGYLNNNGYKSTLQNVSYNSTYSSDNIYVGYMYGTSGSSKYEDTHKNENDSTIKKKLDSWYSSNLKAEYEEYIDSNAGFCNDRQINTTPNQWWKDDTAKGYKKEETAYAPMSRFSNSNGEANEKNTPTFKCSQINDTFTLPGAQKLDGSDYGNHKLRANNGTGDNSPIGLITADEVVFAGGYRRKSDDSTNNRKFYLYTNAGSWTMSPYRLSVYAEVFCLNYGIEPDAMYNTDGARPVINLSANVKLSGDGTYTNPYIVQ